MPAEECGVRIRREKVHFEGLSLHVGHEWIEFVDSSGQVTFSAGLWPGGGWFQTIFDTNGGQVASPDPTGGKTSPEIFTVDIFPQPGETPYIDDCEDADCADIQKCIRDLVDHEKSSPPAYSLLLYNCRHWVTNILEQCCLSDEE